VEMLYRVAVLLSVAGSASALSTQGPLQALQAVQPQTQPEWAPVGAKSDISLVSGNNNKNDEDDTRYTKEGFRKSSNNMCGLYLNMSFAYTGQVQCSFGHDSEAACSSACDGEKTCMSWIYHPPLNSYKAADYDSTTEYFLCQNDPYTGMMGSPTAIADWAGQCCMRKDDKWQPFLPAPWFSFTAEKPHVTSGTKVATKLLSMAADVPDYMSTTPQAAGPSEELALEQVAHDYAQYGNMWTVLRSRCLRNGQDLCPAKAFCDNVVNDTEPERHPGIGSQTTASWYKITRDAGGKFTSDFFSQTSGQGAISDTTYYPVLSGCNTWLHAKTCTIHDGAVPANGDYLDIINQGEIMAGCCEPTLQTDQDAQQSGHKARVFLSKSRHQILREINPAKVKKQVELNGRAAVLRIVVNHETIGLFAALQWVLLAMRFAKSAGLHAYVDHSACTLCGYAPFPLKYKYFDSGAGPNVWEYFFRPVDNGLNEVMKSANCGDNCKDANADVLTLDTWHIWKLYDSSIAAYDPHRDTTAFNQSFWLEHRQRAWELFSRDSNGLGVDFADTFATQEVEKWKTLQVTAYSNLAQTAKLANDAASENRYTAAAAAVAPTTKIWPNPDAQVKVIGLHIRGTDKQCSIGGPIIPPSNYYPLVDLYIEQHPAALIFLATDSPTFLADVKSRYGGRVMTEEAVRSEKNALHVDYAGRLETYGKGLGAIVDAVHLSRCDFMLHANSAVSEFSHWLAGTRLHAHAFNMQFDIATQLQANHAQVFGQGIMQLAQTYNPPVCPKAATTARRSTLAQRKLSVASFGKDMPSNVPPPAVIAAEEAARNPAVFAARTAAAAAATAAGLPAAEYPKDSPMAGKSPTGRCAISGKC